MLILIAIPIFAAYADEFKATYNYNLDDVAFQICKDEFDIYENAASMHMGDPHKLMQWKQYTQCHDDAFLVLQDTQQFCSDEVKKLKNSKTIAASLDTYERLHYDYNLVAAAEDTIDCHVRVYHEEMAKSQTIQTIEQIPKQTPEPKIICGKGTIEKNGQCVVDSNYKPNESSKGGGCLIATATFGSELAPQVQQLRELRDNSLLQTKSGKSFINAFNDVYYLFSPIIADYERENPIFKEMVKITITPMISSLSILNYVDMDSESSVLGYGISLIVLNVGMYFVVPAIVIVRIRKRF